MDLVLRGKRALVSGSTSGLGRAIAVELAAEGASVVVHGRRRDEAEATARLVEASGVAAAVAIGDLTLDVEADAVVRHALTQFGGIDILVNCAGGPVRPDNPNWTEVTPQDWLDSLNLNVLGALRLSTGMAPGMIDAGWGRIVNITSAAGQIATGNLHDYGSAKAALDLLTINLSKNLASSGVTVNAVVPGVIMSPAVERWIGVLRERHGWADDRAENERVYIEQFHPQPVPRLGRPEEVAAAVVFLCSARASYITGASLRVDGGMASTR